MMLLDAPDRENIMEGIKMELEDSSLPLLREINFTSNLKSGFKDCEYAILMGGKRRNSKDLKTR